MLGKRPTKTLFECANISPSVESAEGLKGNQGNLSTSESIKVPRYIPPKLPERIVATPVRGELHCIKKKLIIGNISRWIPVSERDDTASHKWMVYVRGPKEEPNVSSFISQVIFFLHPSYAPHDTIHVLSHPFHVTRRGWGEFPLRIQVHFHNPLCKPVNIIHNLKLDRSYSGLQTLGAETIVDVMIFDSKIDRSSFSAVDEDTANDVEKKEKSASKLDNISVLASEDGVNVETYDPNKPFGSPPQYSEATNAATPQCNHPSEISTRSSECDDDEIGCSLVESNGFSKVDLLTDMPNKTSQSEMPQAWDNNVVDRDHDYFITGSDTRRENETMAIDSSVLVLPKQDRNAEEFSKQFPSLASTSCSATHTGKVSATPDPAVKPVLVRCFNKNGKTFKLPLALLRNAFILQPYRLAKAGESLLRSTISNSAITTDLPAEIVQPVLGKVISATPRSQIIPKVDPNRRDRIGLETKFNNERKSCEAFFDQICTSAWSSVRDCVRVLARKLSLISPKAEDPVYRSLHPYTSPSLEIFISWNVGKRRSAEWTRAKLIRRTLLKCSFASDENTWTTKVIMNWCRRQGYSPMCCWSQTSSTFTKCQPFVPPALSPDEIVTLSKTQFDNSQLSSEDEVTVEVESLIELDGASSSTTHFPKASFLLNDPDPRLTSWIVDSIEKHGFKLGSDLCEDFLIPLSRVLLSHIWREVAEDLLRRSLSQTWQRTRGAIPDEISLIDTYTAISHRPQFDILTNVGLATVDHNDHQSNLAT
ncbi:YEATS domain-containing protein 2-like isoform X2 [Daphnia carinata]|nr:YEATS domain-containing protein 2-like isoform X2 [Daphnia carinata]XP_057375565.1 YEATS domain-containing protein 2-like isoform X2 [Daphnia carinata]